MSDASRDASEKTLKCSRCNEDKPESEYSSKQKKLKGKRKCQPCADVASAENLSNPPSAKPKKAEGKASFAEMYLNKAAAGNAVVKSVLADDVEKAQLKFDHKAVIPDADRYETLLTWLKDGGAKYPNLLLKYYTVDYRGVHARRRLENDEIILEVPLPLIMTSEVAQESEIGKKISSSGCQLRSSHSWLAAFLLQEKYRLDSFWKPYIDTLPQHYRNMPLFFEQDELDELKGSFSLQMIDERKISLKMEYDNIVKHVPEFGEYHYLDFFWARLAVITRIFGFEVNNYKTDGLVAMADMLNHKRPNETSWTFDQSRNAFTITTTKRILKGAQIFDSYGRKCNSRYFVNYGFSLDQNEDNQVAMFFSIPKSDPNYQIKLKLLGQPTRRFQIPFEHKERVTRKCVSYLRVALASQDELLEFANLKSVEKIDPLNIQLECRVMQEVARVAKEVLAGFPTSLAEDNKLLQDGKLTMNVRNCVLMRRGEKEVLVAYIDLAERLAEVVDFDLRRLKKYIASNLTGRGKMPSFEWRLQMYFEEFWLPFLTGERPELEEMNNSLEE